MLTLLLLFGLSFDVGHKCDNYFFGNVNYRGVSDDHTATLQGCKKGCFYNYTVTEEGVPKCEKCSEISDEKECLSHAATCQWTKGGKCASQSCPNIAKIRVALAGANDQSTIRSQTEYRELVSKETECVEGSALEKKYNDMYLSDYVATFNYRFAIWNVEDTCTMPRSKARDIGGYNGYRYAWDRVRSANGTANAAACGKFIGYTHVPDTTVPDPLLDDCNERPCNDPTRAGCNAIPGCIWIWGTNTSDAGGSCQSAGTPGVCTFSLAGTRWEAGKNNSEDCQKVEGCRYVRGIGGRVRWVYNMGTGSYDYEREDYRVDSSASALSITDSCVPACTGFVAGTHGQRHCEELGCTYDGGDIDSSPFTWTRGERPLENLRTFLDSDPCPANRHAPTDRDALVGDCGINRTLERAFSGYYEELCDDRIYSGDPVQCDIPELTTEESCIAGYGNWTPLPKTCRKLPSTERQLCEFKARNATGYISESGSGYGYIYEVWVDVGKHGGNRKAGTAYDYCVRQQYDRTDDWKTKNITSWDNLTDQLAAYLTPDDHERIYGFKKPEDYCQHELEKELKRCQTEYEDAVRLCHKEVTSAEINPATWERSYERVKATRSACHRIYGCMYSKSNERCSVWAVWAFILILVLTIVVFVAVVVVGGIVLARVFGLSSA